MAQQKTTIIEIFVGENGAPYSHVGIPEGVEVWVWNSQALGKKDQLLKHVLPLKEEPHKQRDTELKVPFKKDKPSKHFNNNKKDHSLKDITHKPALKKLAKSLLPPSK